MHIVIRDDQILISNWMWRCCKKIINPADNLASENLNQISFATAVASRNVGRAKESFLAADLWPLRGARPARFGWIPRPLENQNIPAYNILTTFNLPNFQCWRFLNA